MYARASTFLSTHINIATTARQRLDLVRHRRHCNVHLDAFDSIFVPPHVLERGLSRCRVQADAVLVENPVQA